MPAADHLFAPANGDTLARSRSGLAHSDREIEQMRAWIQAGDERLLEVVAALGDCLKAAAAAMKPVRPSGHPGMGGPFPEDALMRHADSLAEVTEAAERVVRAANFVKAPFFGRHFIPSGGMPDGLRPQEFDKHRNDEAVYDKARKEAIDAAAIRAREEEAERAREAERQASQREADEEREEGRRVIAEFLAEQPAKAKRIFESRLRDAAFEASAIAAIQAASGCIAAAAVSDAEKVGRYEQRLAKALGADPELRAMWRFYLENAERPVKQVIESQRMPKANITKALSELRKLGERIEKTSARPAPSPAKTKSKKRA
jgi:hypothetical protein